MNVIPSFGDICFCRYTASKLKRTFFCGFLSWRMPQSFQFHHLFFEPELMNHYFSVEDAVCLELLPTLIVQTFVVLSKSLDEFWTLELVLTFHHIAGESRWGRGYLNNLTDLSTHSSTNFYYSDRKNSLAVIDSAIFWASEELDSIYEGRTDIFLNLTNICSIDLHLSPPISPKKEPAPEETIWLCKYFVCIFQDTDLPCYKIFAF